MTSIDDGVVNETWRESSREKKKKKDVEFKSRNSDIMPRLGVRRSSCSLSSFGDFRCVGC